MNILEQTFAEHEHLAPDAADVLREVRRAVDGRHRVNRRALAVVGVGATVAAVAAVAAGSVVLGGTDDPARRPAAPGGSARHTSAPPSTVHSTVHSSTHPTPRPAAKSPAALVLDDAAAKLDATPAFAAPDPQDFFYVRTTEATSWTSVSGRREGETRTVRGDTSPIGACVHGSIVAHGEEGTCTLQGTPHYLADAPTEPAAWDAYLEAIAPGAKAGGAQGKIIQNTLYFNLLQPSAAAALLRYTETCPGMRTMDLTPVQGHDLVGVTCPSMSASSYGLAFDATTHAFAGFAPVDYQTGAPDGPSIVVLQTGIVSSIGDTP